MAASMPNLIAPDSCAVSLRAFVLGESGADPKARVLKGCTILQAGDGYANDWCADEATLRRAMELAESDPKGLKARWTRPAMFQDGLGKYLGRWKNFRLTADKQALLADLHLSRLAFRGKYSRGQWILDMAEEAPDTFCVLLSFAVDEAAMEEDGINGKLPMRFARLVAADFVDETNVNEGLFGDRGMLATPPAITTAGFPAKLKPTTATHKDETMTPAANPNGFDATLAYRQFACDQIREHGQNARFPRLSVQQLQERYPNAGAIAPAGSPGQRIKRALAAHYQGMRLETLCKAVGEYESQSDWFGKHGCSLSDFLSSVLVDDGLCMPTELAEALDAEQSSLSLVMAKDKPCWQ